MHSQFFDLTFVEMKFEDQNIQNKVFSKSAFALVRSIELQNFTFSVPRDQVTREDGDF